MIKISKFKIYSIFIFSLLFSIACDDNSIDNDDDNGGNNNAQAGVVINNAPMLNTNITLEVNSQMPEYNLKIASGEIVDLSFPGKPVIIKLWASWCSICRSIEPDYDNYIAEKGIDIIPFKLSYDYTVSDLRTYLEKKAETKEIVSNHIYDLQENDFRKAIDKPGIPRVIVINSTGKITYIGPFNPPMIDLALDSYFD